MPIAEGDTKSKQGSRSCFIDDDQKLTLAPGKYIVQVKLAEKTKGGAEGTLQIYSEDFLEFVPRGHKKILNEVFLTLGEGNDFKDQSGEGCQMASGWWSIYHYFYFENKSASKWETELKFENMVNIKVGKPFKTSSSSLKVIVDPGSKQVAYLEKVDLSEDADF